MPVLDSCYKFITSHERRHEYLLENDKSQSVFFSLIYKAAVPLLLGANITGAAILSIILA